MIKKIIIISIGLLLIPTSFGAIWKKKEKPSLFLSKDNPKVNIIKEQVLSNESIFKKQTRIYFLVYVPEGFSSNYIKYQIIKQDNNAHIGGYSRIRNKVCRVNDKNYYTDYFVIQDAGKYALQIFNIDNQHHWITYGHFRVIDE